MAWSIQNKTCVVTGASSGIGLVTARVLAERGARVLLVSRNKERGDAAVSTVKTAAPNADVQLILGDLASFEQIRRVAAEILEKAPRLDVLINNAGALNTKRTVTADGHETTFAVNHLAYFLLTHLLLDRLKASAPARIVNVASEAHRRGHINFDDLEGAKKFDGYAAYQASKLANILFTYELAKRLEGSGVTANCLHPGVIASGFALNASGPVNWFFRLAKPFLLTNEQGAETTIHLATAPELEGKSGGYYKEKRLIRSNRESNDPAVARRLWEISEQMIKEPAHGI